jgi:hypothetical protein
MQNHNFGDLDARQIWKKLLQCFVPELHYVSIVLFLVPCLDNSDVWVLGGTRFCQKIEDSPLDEIDP